MSRHLDPASDRSAYRQIADFLRGDIVEGRLQPGERLPSERELMEEFGAARGTVREAISLLKGEGLLQAEQGRGVFVRARPRVRCLAHDRFARRHREAGKAAFMAEADSQGYAGTVEVIEVASSSPALEVSQRLGLAEGQAVLVRRRRYLADGTPVEMATSFIPWELAEGTPMTQENPGPGGIYARLEEIGHRLGRFAEEVSARMPSPDERRALSLPSGVPVLEVNRIAYDEGGRAVELCRTVMSADAYVLDYVLPAT